MKCIPIIVAALSTTTTEAEYSQSVRSTSSFLQDERKTEQSFCETINDTVPPKESTCWTFNKVGEEITQKGCDHEACEAAVCECDPYCCSFSWDLNCRGHDQGKSGMPKDNYFTPNCSASILCCEEDDIPSTLRLPCSSDSSVNGYTDIVDLIDDIKNDGSKYSGVKDGYLHEYVLCPHTIFDLGNSSDYSIVPVLSNTVIKCGADGSSSNNCTITGGENQVIFHPEVSVNDVKFLGITMTQSFGVSVIAWSPSPSFATFIDCHWKDNNGYSVIDVYRSNNSERRRMLSDSLALKSHERTYEQIMVHKLDFHKLLQEKHHSQNTRSIAAMNAMTVSIMDCSFTNNDMELGVIFNIGGLVETSGINLESNRSPAVAIGVSQGATLTIDGKSKFTSNTNGFSTIFADYKSTVKIDADAIGSNNIGNICDDIFVESEGSTCLSVSAFSETCDGTCCEFREVSCFSG